MPDDVQKRPCSFHSTEQCYLIELDELCREGQVEKAMEKIKHAEELCCLSEKIEQIKQAAERLNDLYEQYSNKEDSEPEDDSTP